MSDQITTTILEQSDIFTVFSYDTIKRVGFNYSSQMNDTYSIACANSSHKHMHSGKIFFEGTQVPQIDAGSNTDHNLRHGQLKQFMGYEAAININFIHTPQM